MSNKVVIFANDNAWLPESEAAIVIQNNKKIFEKPDAKPVELSGAPKKYRGAVPWGEDNKVPNTIMEKSFKSPIMVSNHGFNAFIGFGEGIIPARRIIENEKVKFEPVLDNKEINEFFENNDINGYFLEQLTDLNYFYITFPEIILNQEKPEDRKIVELNSKEAVFSRWEEANKNNGLIEHHFYSSKWSEEGSPDFNKDVVATEVLHPKNSILDLKRRIGREARTNGKTKDDKTFRYIVPVSIPTPGRKYYPKPPYYSLFESGWYDFAILIPEFKTAFLSNQMTIKYVVYLADDYFDIIFSEEGITKDEDQKARVKKEYENINNYLSGAKNAGKAVITKEKFLPDGKTKTMMRIEVVDNKIKGGEYIEDSEEVSNIMSYGMGVHPSMVGSAPGKNKNINGTEARELFLIKQSMMKPIRDRLLKPLYVVKAINKWPQDIHFMVPNIELTTLDKSKTGTTNQIEE